MLFGAAIGSAIQNPILAIILALLGHYFLDIFPHIEYLDGVESSIEKLRNGGWPQSAANTVKVLIDFLLGALLIFIFSNSTPVIYACALVAIVPDGLTVIHSLFPKLGLAAHHHIHSKKIHYLTKQKNFPVSWKIATQVIAAVMSIIILITG